MREPLDVSISEIRGGEDHDGPLESTDLFIRGRGVSLLVNVLAGSAFTYALGVDGQDVSHGQVGVAALPAAWYAALEAAQPRLIDAIAWLEGDVADMRNCYAAGSFVVELAAMIRAVRAAILPTKET